MKMKTLVYNERLTEFEVLRNGFSEAAMNIN